MMSAANIVNGTKMCSPKGVKNEVDPILSESPKGKEKQEEDAIKPEAIEESDEDGLDDDNHTEDYSSSMGVDRVDLAAQNAILSTNVINLMSPPLPLYLGRWNDRPLIEKEAVRLLATMQRQDFRMFRFENMIPLIVSKADIEPSCIYTKISCASQAPELKLTEHGKSKLQLDAPGGRHRYRAVQLAVKKAKDEIRKLRDQLSRERSKTLKTEDAKQAQAQRMRALREAISGNVRVIAKISRWGVIIYDSEKMYARGGELARHISRNWIANRYAETEAEKLLMLVRMYLAIDENGTEVNRSLFLQKLEGQRSAVGQVMNYAETREYLLVLNDLAPHFHYHKVYSTTWIKTHLHAVGGGIVITLVRYLANIWKTLFSPTKRFEDDEEWEDYKRGVEQGSIDDSYYCIRGWKDMVDRDIVNTRKPAFELWTPAFMKSIEDLGVGGKALTLLTGDDNRDAKQNWRDYIDGVYSVVEEIIMECPFTDKQHVQVQNKILRNLDFIFYNHGDNHYQRRLPLLTPDIIMGLSARMDRIKESLSEFLKWFDPYVDYFTFNLKNSDSAKDMAAWILRTIRSNKDNRFHRAEMAADQLAHFVFKNYPLFLHMEETNTVLIPPRPQKHGDQKISKVKEIFANVTEKRDKLVDLMKKSKHNGSTGNWVLDFQSHYDWRDATRKHATRDYKRWALAAYIESTLVEKYRKTLLETCDAAFALRRGAQDLLSRFCNPSVGSSSSPTYIYPDRIVVDRQSPQIEISVGDCMNYQGGLQTIRKQEQEFFAHVKKIDNFEFMSAIPGSEEIREEIGILLRKLVKVVHANIYRLEAMRRVADPDSIDPSASEWDTKFFERTEIPINLRPMWSKPSRPQELARQQIPDHVVQPSSDYQTSPSQIPSSIDSENDTDVNHVPILNGKRAAPDSGFSPDRRPTKSRASGMDEDESEEDTVRRLVVPVWS